MNSVFSDVRWVGFDLDRTLYAEDARLRESIRGRIVERLLAAMPQVGTADDARRFCESRYEAIGSWTQVLVEAGVRNAKAVMHECLASPEDLAFIHRDPCLVRILRALRRRYGMFLVTSSPRDLAESKLRYLGIPVSTFAVRIFGDMPEFGSKTDGTAFRNAMRRTGCPAGEHVFVGDSVKADVLPAKRLGMLTIAVWKDVPEATLSVRHIHDVGRVLL